MVHICETAVLKLILKRKHFSCLAFRIKFCEKVQDPNISI